jgi:hypothetical protein
MKLPCRAARSRRLLALLLVLSAMTSAVLAGPPAPPRTPAQAAPKQKPEEKYLRLRRDKQGRPIAMEAAIVRFEPADRSGRGPVVDLVGAVHVAEPGFYARLNREFDGYDAVLYELVAPTDTRPAPGQAAASGSPISAVQTSLTKLLNLQFQLDGIDYRQANMVHADMSPDEFSRSMRDRGETVWSMFFRMLGAAMIQQAQDPAGTSDMELLMALVDTNRSLALKRAMAKQFENLGGVMMAIEGPNGSTLVSQRNKKALSVLRRELAAGKRKVAIFYGAAHMPDMAKRLESDFGLKPTSTRWLTAWDMTEPQPKK